MATLTIIDAVAHAQARRLSTPRRVRIAQEAASIARSTAAVLTGEYRDGIGVEVSGDHVMIVDDDPDAIHKEYGTSRTAAHAAVTNAASQFGRYRGTQPRR